MSEIAVEEHQARQAGEGLVHTCATHPRMSDGPHVAGCKAFCGVVSKSGRGDRAHLVRGSDSCVVCDAMFDALYRRST